MRESAGKIGRVSPSLVEGLAAGAIHKGATSCNLAVDCIACCYCCEGRKDSRSLPQEERVSRGRMAVCYFASTLGMKRPRSEGEDSEEEEWEEEWSQRWSGRYGA